MPITNFPHGISSFGVPVAPGMQSGVGLGDVYWVTANRTSDLYFTKLSKRVSRGNIFPTLQAAHDACTTDQGDTIFMAPGIYTSTAEIDFTKSNINVVAMDGPNTLLTYTASKDHGGVTLHNAVAGIVNTLHVTGARNKFWGLHVTNSGAHAANYSALKIGGGTAGLSYGNYFNRCTFHGCMNASQNTSYSSSVEIASSSSNYMFEDCVIGQNTYGGNRATLYQGHLLYTGNVESGAGPGYATQNGMFRGCSFLSRTATAIVVPIVRIGSPSYDHTTGQTGDEPWDRIHYWINCTFSNWPSTTMPTVFYNNCGSGAGVAHLYNCAAYNYGEWRTVYASQIPNTSLNVMVNMGIPVTTDPGIAIEATA